VKTTLYFFLGLGAILPKRDAIDTRIISDTRNGTATYEGPTYAQYNSIGFSHPSGIIDSQKDAGGYPDYASGEAPADTDHDGMPDAWESSKGLDPNNAKDGNEFTLNKSYTNLEVYLNNGIGM
jgi:hypothetical protein